jgi:hypothetical protein
MGTLVPSSIVSIVSWLGRPKAPDKFADGSQVSQKMAARGFAAGL